MPISRQERQQYRASIKEVSAKFDTSLMELRLMVKQMQDGFARMPAVYGDVDTKSVLRKLDDVEDVLFDLVSDLAKAEASNAGRPTRGA